MFERLDTPGGHIAVCFILILTGAGLYLLHIPKAEDLIVGGGAVIFAAMRGTGKTQGPPSSAAPSTQPTNQAQA